MNSPLEGSKSIIFGVETPITRYQMLKFQSYARAGARKIVELGGTLLPCHMPPPGFVARVIKDEFVCHIYSKPSSKS